MLDNIRKYFLSLLPNFDKVQIIDDMKSIRKELLETLPVLSAAQEFFKTWSFKSKEVEDFNQRFQKNVKQNRKINFVVAIYDLVNNISENLSTLEKLVDKHFADDVNRDGLTYVKVNLLKYVELVSFSIRYSRALLLWVYQNETNAIDKNQEVSLTKGEINWLKKNADAFFDMYPALSISKSELERAIANIPDILVDSDNIDVVASTVGINKLDPLKTNLIFGTTWNIIYHFRMAVAEWQVDRYKQTIEERRVLEYRLMMLKNSVSGNIDPKLEQNISYHETRLQAMNTKLLKFEEDLHG